MTDPDAQFFIQHPDRTVRIRLPGRAPYKDQQRGVRYLSESEIEFRHLGPHDARRRRIIAYRTEADHPTHPNTIVKIPFLAFADEAISDDDQTLLPILTGIMMEAAKA